MTETKKVPPAPNKVFTADNIPKPPSKEIIKVPKPPSHKEKVKEDQIVYLDNGIAVAAPSAIEIEKAVIGALLVDVKALEFVDKIKAEIFYSHKHKVIFRAIEKIHKDNEKVDLLTVTEKLKSLEQSVAAGGDYYVISLSQVVNSSAHLDYHLKIVLQKYILREIIKSSRENLYSSLHSNPDIFTILENTSLMLAKVDNIISLQKNGSNALDPKKQLEEKIKNKELGIVSGVPTGFFDFDDKTGGFQNRELITIAARPGMGKTTFMISASKHSAIDKDIDIAVFSLEMASIDLTYRYAANLAEVDYEKIRSGDLNIEESKKVFAAIDYIKTSKLHIFDTSEHKNYFEKIVKKIRELVEMGIKAVYIDYVQLIKLSVKLVNRTAEINQITRDLKALANELNVPIIIFAQLNRGVENRTDKMPMLADLKESGSIEEDSDTVIFLLREAYYQAKSGIVDLPPRVIGETKFNVAKGRNIGTFLLIGHMDFFRIKFISKSEIV